MPKKLIINTQAQLVAENEDLKRRLEEAEETLNAIRNGEVDAIIVSGAQGEQVYTLKQAEEALRVSEEKYSQLVEEINDGVYVTDYEGVFTFANPALARIYGVETPQALVGRKILDFVAPEMLEELGQAFRNKMRAGRAPEFINSQIRRPDGTRVFIEDKPTSRVIGGKVVGSHGVVRDITERKKTEEELINTNKELAFQNGENEKRAAELIFANKELVYQNEEKEKRAAELIIANKELVYQNEEKGKRAAELIIANKELVYQNEEKQKRAVELSTVVGNLKRSEELLRETGAIAKMGGAEINLSNMTFNWTDEVFRIHELEPGRMPSVEEAIDFFAPDARPIIQEAINNAIANSEGWNLELPFFTSKGKYLWVRTIGKPEMKDGKTSRILCVFQDITERKQAEEALRNREDMLQKIFDTLPVGLWIADKDGKLLRGNPAGVKIWSAEPKVGPPDYGIFKGRRLPSGEDIKAGDWALAHTIRDKVTIVDELLEIDAFDGKKKTILNFSAPVLDAQGVIQGAIVVNQDITELKQAENRIRRQLEHLLALSNIDRVIASNFDLNLSLSEILLHVTKELGVDAADILILNPGLQMLEFSAGQGFRTNAVRNAHVRLGEGYAGQAALERKLVRIPNMQAKTDNPNLTLRLTGEDFVWYYGVPLIAKGQVKGVLEVFHRGALEPDAEWFDFLNTLAGQTAVAIENSTLFESLQRSNSELGLAYDATIEGWSHALDLRDEETEGHTLRVTEMTVKLARLVGLSEADLVQVRWGALLHDIGKMGVPDRILLKPGPLTDEEWLVMKKHPSFAYEMLSPIRYLRLALDIPYCHHEKWDGSGYPRALKGAQIPLVARVFAVVDVWDALRSDRPYRPAWTEEKVREHIRSSAGTHFDPQVVDSFMQLLG